MPRLHVFSDETGDFHFSRGAHASRYFMICTVSMRSCDIGTELLDLRRNLLFQKAPVNESFHASEDRQIVRDAVFSVIAGGDIEIQATVFEKSKAPPEERTTNADFFRYAWFHHFKYAGPKIIGNQSEALITVAKIHTNKQQAAFSNAVHGALQQTVPRTAWTAHFCMAATDPCLQVADYCACAFHKKWESNEVRPYNTIRGKITHELDLWEHGKNHYF